MAQGVGLIVPKDCILDLTCIEYFNMKKINLLIAATLIGITIYSCDSRTYKDIEDPNIVAPTNPTYNADVKRIIDDKCISCHSSNATDNQEPYLETYNEVKNACEAPGNINLICRIEGTACGAIMPTSGIMPSVKINTIKNWKNQNYPEN